MQRLFFFTLFLVFAIFVAIFSLPYILSSDDIWNKINPELEAQLGRKFEVNGERNLRVYPNLAIEISDVKIGNGINDEEFVTLNSARIELDLWAIINQEVKINQINVDGAEIFLKVYANGANNWEAGATQNPNADPLAALIEENTQEAAPTSDAEPFDLSKVNIENFKITNSLVNYQDLQIGDTHEIKNINAQIDLAETNKRLGIIGDFSYNGVKNELSLSDLNLIEMLNAQQSRFKLSLTSVLLNLNLDGLLHFSDKFVFDGHAALNAPSYHNINNWLKQPAIAVNDSKLSLDTNVKLVGSSVQITNLIANIFNTNIQGGLNVSIKDRINLFGKIAIGVINLDQILPKQETAGNAAPVSDKIDVSFLNMLDSNLQLNIGQLVHQNNLFKNFSTNIKIRKGKLSMPATIEAFGGKIATNIAISPLKSGLSLSQNTKISSLNIGDALIAYAETDQLKSILSADIQAQTSGATIDNLLNNLNGKGAIELLDGEIKGIEMADALAPELANFDLSINNPAKLAAFAKNAGKNLLQKEVEQKVKQNFSAQTGDEKVTKFVKATLSFDIVKGLLTNKDLAAQSENIFIYGEGDTHLGKQTINYRIIPKFRKNNATGSSERMFVPMFIAGTWSDPKISIDYKYAMKNSSQLQKVQKQITDKITQKIKTEVGDKIVKKATDKITKKAEQIVTKQLGNAIGGQVKNQVGNLLNGVLPKELQQKQTTPLPEALPEQEPQALPDALPEEKPKQQSNNLLNTGNLINNLLGN